jgi:hypothetical protein
VPATGLATTPAQGIFSETQLGNAHVAAGALACCRKQGSGREDRTSGAKARIFWGADITAEAVTYPKPFMREVLEVFYAGRRERLPLHEHKWASAFPYPLGNQYNRDQQFSSSDGKNLHLSNFGTGHSGKYRLSRLASTIPT